jgi:hypothetical protein
MKVCQANSQPKTSARPDFPITLNKLYINGEWRDSYSGKTFPAIDPTTEAQVALVAEGTVEDVELAVKAAQTAFVGAWGQMNGHERGEILWRIGDLFLKYGQELAFLQAKEMGRLFTDSMTVDIPLRTRCWLTHSRHQKSTQSRRTTKGRKRLGERLRSFRSLCTVWRLQNEWLWARTRLGSSRILSPDENGMGRFVLTHLLLEYPL